ncbi:hypothetical protein CCY01nite_49980 [Chitinophaga cymbidii]|uniref:Uncharacterized protein n=1 Tax=Chitinophaga cymbidii TaxID=1096750 RepID=A0A512RSR3_9BACT|nr:hypothetical protein CCY01nite_49980 [Chitinophaga cymbidii]
MIAERTIQLNRWTGITLINLFVVAVLGVLLRSVQLFPIPFVEYKFVLHAHSHFAFGGWVTLALAAWMTGELLVHRPVYKWWLSGLLLTSVGMLLSFPFQGYGPVSIPFSMLFITCTYGFAYTFIKDLRHAAVSRSVRLLVKGALGFLVLSSLGPFTLAILMATGTHNPVLYNDAIYGYLHLQYSGFFTPAIFALLFHRYKVDNRQFVNWLLLSVLPTVCLTWLWHAPGIIVYIIAMVGSVLLIGGLTPFMRMRIAGLPWLAKVALGCFVLKQVLQACTVIPGVGDFVFFNRPVIIGYLHLVLLGFVTLYLLSHFRLPAGNGMAVFVAGVVMNEVALFAQGLRYNNVYPWLLLAASVLLAVGALLLCHRSFFRNTRIASSKGATAQHIIQATE